MNTTYIQRTEDCLFQNLRAILSLAKSLDVEYNQKKIDEIKTSIRNGILTITAYTDSDISLEEREFNIAQEFFLKKCSVSKPYL